MSKQFDPPKVTTKTSAVKTNKEITETTENVDEVVKVNAMPTSKVVTDIGDIYVQEIDRFTKFINNELNFTTLEERNKEQINFVKTFEKIVTSKPVYMNKALNHFVKVVNENPLVYTMGKILAPFHKVEKELGKIQANKYKIFMQFIISYAKNIRNKDQLLRGFDVEYFVGMYPEPYRTNLHNFIFD